MIIDTHTHVLDHAHWPTQWWQWVAQDWAAKAPGRRPADIEPRVEGGLTDPDGLRLVASMDDAGVDRSVVLPIDWGPDYTGVKPIAEIVGHALGLQRRYGDRLIAFAGIDPRREQATDLVAEWLELGAKGLKLYPSCGWHPESDEAAAVYELCNAARVPVLFHTGDPLPVMNPHRAYSNPQLLGEVARSFPDMPIWLGHAGAPAWWDEAIELTRMSSNVHVEMSVWIWDDSTPEQMETFVAHVAEVLQAVGAGRILFGSDNLAGARIRKQGFLRTVLQAYRDLPGLLAARGVVLSDEDLALILGGNAVRDLRLTPSVP